MSKQSHKPANMLNMGKRIKKKRISHTINTSHELHIMQNIGSDQLADMEKTYLYMVEAIREARRAKNKASNELAEILKHGVDMIPINRRRDLKTAWLWEHGKKSQEIDTIMHLQSGYSLNRVLASHGRAIKRKLILAAKTRLVIKSVAAGNGIRPTARAIPAALGACSPSLVSKIMKAEKMRNQNSLPFSLFAVT